MFSHFIAENQMDICVSVHTNFEWNQQIVYANMENRSCKGCENLAIAASAGCVQHYLHYAQPDLSGFHTAAKHGHKDIISTLAKHHDLSNINLVGKYRCSPLKNSIIFGYPECTMALLQCGANAGIQTERGKSVIDLVLRSNRASRSEYIIWHILTFSFADLNVSRKDKLNDLNNVLQDLIKKQYSIEIYCYSFKLYDG